MKITKIEKHTGSGMWHGTATIGAKNYEWFYEPRRRFAAREQNDRNPRCWMYVEPPPGAKRAVLRAVRMAKAT
jgi:hypothetical protein